MCYLFLQTIRVLSVFNQKLIFNVLYSMWFIAYNQIKTNTSF